MNHEAAHDRVTQAYARLASKLPGFRDRAGQRTMVQEITDTLADAAFEAKPAESEDGMPRVCVVQGGTGVGKTVGFLCPTLVLAREKKVKVLVSTATVALQEQLLRKDLPALAAAMPEPFTFGLLKGRSRYCCLTKLDRVLGGSQGDLLATPAADPTNGDAPPSPDPQANAEAVEAPQRTIDLYRKARGELVKRAWAGDRDSLAEPMDEPAWQRIAADRTACTGSSCEHYRVCPYYQAKRAITQVDVIVANHDLVLSSLRNDARAIPGGDRAIYVFDEGHHLPSVAINHFAASAGISAQQWVGQLERAAALASGTLSQAIPPGWVTRLGALRERMATIERMVLDLYGSTLRKGGDRAKDKDGGARVRLAHGVVPQALADALTQLGIACKDAVEGLSGMVDLLKENRAAQEDRAPLFNGHLTELGPHARRLDDLLALCELMLSTERMPPAKWVDLDVRRGQVSVTLQACPMHAGGLLHRHLWSQLRAAVLTSATLKTLGSFAFMLRESGLAKFAHVRCVDVPSPFDYAAQGKLVVVQTQASPKAADAHTAEVAQMLVKDLAGVARGALVLCSSRTQLKSLVDTLPPALKACALVQGTKSREAMLAAHAARVKAGERSILFGLRSFGEGLDLPGNLCEAVFVPKLPFAPPTDPVLEARAEWLDAKGRNSFVELTVPATGVTLNQWAGRGIRTETDRVTIICYDERLSSTPYGRKLLGGLPAFRMVRRHGGMESPLELCRPLPRARPCSAAPAAA